MKKCVIIIFLMGELAFSAQAVWAAGAIMARQRMQQQQAMQQAMQQQAVQQQIAAQVSSQVQAQAHQVAQHAVQQAAQQAALQMQYQAQIAAAQAVLEAQRAAAQAAAQTALATSYQAQQVAAQVAAQQAAVVQGVAQRKATTAQEAGLLQQIIESRGVPPSADDVTQIEEIATLDQVLQSLDQSSRAWPLMVDMEAKVVVVDQYITRFRQQGIGINKDGYHYAQLIDGISGQSPEMLQQPFPRLLEIAAILEYDFNNGYDKDAMAQQILRSPEAVAANKKRLGIQ